MTGSCGAPIIGHDHLAAALVRRESRVLRLMRRAVVAAACLYAVSCAWSTYRRLRQILRLEARASSLVLTPGSTVGYDVITSGEVQNRIRLELVQGARREVLLERRAHEPDPEPRPARLSGHAGRPDHARAARAIRSGAATLRVTGSEARSSCTRRLRGSASSRFACDRRSRPTQTILSGVVDVAAWIVDLCDTTELARRSIRPDRLASRQLAVTQRIAQQLVSRFARLAA
jgi:hypothetical protein